MSDTTGARKQGLGVNFPGRVQRSGTSEYVPPQVDYNSLFGNTDNEFLSGIPKKTNYLRDVGVDSLNAVVSAGEAVAGLGRLAGFGRVLDAAGYRPGVAHEMISDLYSDGRKATEADIQASIENRKDDSFLSQVAGGAMDYVRHPSALVGGLVNNAPGMLLGGGAARAMALKLFGAAEAAALARGATAAEARLAGQAAIDASPGLLKTAGAVGEGAITSGQIAQSIHDKDPNSNIYAAIPAGLITGLISRGAGAIHGIGDAETALLTGSRTAGASGNLLSRGVKGGLSETGQELVQSGQERMWQNIGTGSPLMEGVANEAGAGAIQGFAMGGVFGAASKHQSEQASPYNEPVSQSSTQTSIDRAPLSPVTYTGQGELDLLGGKSSGVNVRDVFAGPLPRENELTGFQPSFNYRDQLATENTDASARIASAAESGALDQLDSFGSVLTPRDIHQQDNIASTLAATGNQTQEPLQVIGQGRESLYEQKRLAQSKAARGLLLSSYEAQLLTQDIPAPPSMIELPPSAEQQPQAAIQVADTMRTRPAEPTQLDMFGAPLDKPVTGLPSNDVTVNQADPNQISMFDAKGNPTYQATTNEPPRFDDIAQEAASFFGFKLTEKRKPLVTEIVRAFHEGDVDEDTHDMLLHMIRESKLGQAKRVLDATVADAQDAKTTNTKNAANIVTEIDKTAFTVGGDKLLADVRTKVDDITKSLYAESLQNNKNDDGSYNVKKAEADYASKVTGVLTEYLDMMKSHVDNPDSLLAAAGSKRMAEAKAAETDAAEAAYDARVRGEVDDTLTKIENSRKVKNLDLMQRTQAKLDSADNTEQVQDALDEHLNGVERDNEIVSMPAANETNINNDVLEADPSTAKLKDLMRLHSEGTPVESHPSMTPYDAELELQRRLKTTRNEREADKIGDYLENYRESDNKIELARLKARTEQVQREIRESNDAIARAMQDDRDSSSGFKLDPPTTESNATLASLTNDIFDHIENELIPKLMDLGVVDSLAQVESIQAYNLPANVEGQVGIIDGKYHILVNPNSVSDPEVLSRVLSHELGHVIDNAMRGAVYSNHPALRVVSIDGKVTGVGEVAREIISATKSDGLIKETFNYPLGTEFKYSAEVTSEELFAQVFYMMTNDSMRSMMESKLPKTSQFIKDAIDHAKISISTEAKTGSAEGSSSVDSKATPVQPDRNPSYSFGPRAGEDQSNAVFRSSGGIEKNARYSSSSSLTLADLPEPERTSKFVATISDAFTNVGTKPIVLGFMTLRQIADRFPKVAAFQKYVRAQEAMTTKTKLHQAMVAEIDHDFTRLSIEDALKLSSVMLNATANEWHVDQNFEHESNKHIDRVLAPEFMKARAEFNALSDEQKALYSKVKAKFASDLELQSNLINKRIIDQYRESMSDKVTTRDGKTISLDDAAKITSPEKRHELKLEITTQSVRKNLSRMWDDLDHNTYAVSQIQGPYFPLMRFGEHVVVAKSDALVSAQAALDNAKEELAALNQRDESEYTVADQKAARKAVSDAQAKLNSLKADDKHYLVEFYESETEANNRVRQIEELFRDDPSMNVRRELRSAHFRQLDAAPYAFIKNLETEISKQLPASDAGKIKDAVRDIYIRAMPERAALKSQLNRIKGSVTGAKVAEMRRAVIASGLRNSFNLARMEHGTELNDALTELRLGSTDEEKRLGEEMAKRLVETMSVSPTSHKAITAMSNLSYTTMLGLSPSFLMLNLLQSWTVSAPIMAARHGFTATGKALGVASSEVAANMYESFKANKGFEFDLSKLPEDEAVFIKSMRDKGAIDITQEHDLGAQATGQTDGWTDKLAHWSSIPAHHTEVINRIATSLAAYRLEKQVDLKKNKSNAARYAEKIVSETHLDYTSENSPRYLRASSFGGLGKIIFQFKKYAQGMVFLTFKHAKDGFWRNTEGLNPEERAEARKAFVGLMGTMVAVAGASGTPFTPILSAAAMLIGLFQDKDKDKEYRLRFYQALKEHLGENVATLIMKGVPAALFNIDLSSRAGMGDLLNPFKYASTGSTGQSSVAGYLMALAGPSASLAANYTQAAMDVQSGDLVKAVRTIAPRFIQGPMDAYAMANNGLSTRNGNRYMKPEDISAWDIAMKSVGLNTASLSNLSDARQAMDTAVKERDAVRKSLISSYAKAALLGNDLDSIRDRIADFNSRHGERGVRIDQASLIKARQAEARYERELRNGVHVSRRDRALYEDLMK